MLTRLMKIGAIVALLVGLFAARSPGYGIILQFVVSAAAVAVLVQAAGMRRYLWVVLFVITACIFNPVVPFPFSTAVLGAISTLALLLFWFSLGLLRPTRRLTMASITDRMPGSESL